MCAEVLCHCTVVIIAELCQRSLVAFRNIQCRTLIAFIKQVFNVQNIDITNLGQRICFTFSILVPTNYTQRIEIAFLTMEAYTDLEVVKVIFFCP